MTPFLPTLAQGLDWTIRASLLFAASFLLTFLLRHRSAAIRHFIWSGALVGSLLMPFVMAVTPSYHLPSWSNDFSEQSTSENWLAFNATSEALEVSSAGLIGPFATSDTLASVPERTTDEVASPSPPGPSPPDNADTPAFSVLAVATSLLWLAGTTMVLAGVVMGAVNLWRLRRRAEPLPSELAEELSDLVQELKFKRIITGLMTESRSIPMTWGSLRPVILLPGEAKSWSRDRRRMVFLHELAHIQRWDFSVQLLGQVARAIHWFNPLAWLALDRLRLEQERACDDCVLNAGECAEDYATELVRVTARVPSFALEDGVSLAMRRFERVERRLRAVLEEGRDRQPITPFRAAAFVAVLTAMTALVAIPRSPDARAEEQAAQAECDQLANSKALAATDEPKEKGAESAPKGPALPQILELIQQHSSEDVGSQLLIEAAVKGMLEALKDPYSTLLSSEQIRELQIHLNGTVAGIGAQLSQEQKDIVVIAPVPNSPAVKAGLKPRDVILSVDGAAITELKQAVTAIRGPQGTEVKLRIRRGDTELDLAITRDVVKFGSVRGLAIDPSGSWRHSLDPQTKIGYVRITEFNQGTVAELEASLTKLREQGLNGLILDLRGCPGGLFEPCVKVASAFLKTGTIATLRGRKQPEQTFEVDGSAKYPELPLVVLVDSTTASAGEVLAAALQDHRRAIVIGERTFGKGSVQSLIPVDELNANLKLTTAQIFRADGSTVNRTEHATSWGVNPNDGYYVPITDEQRAKWQEQRTKRDLTATTLPESLTPALILSELSDPTLAAAVKTLSAKLETGEFQASGRPLTEMQQKLDTRGKLEAERKQLLEKLQQIDQQLSKVTQ